MTIAGMPHQVRQLALKSETHIDVADTIDDRFRIMLAPHVLCVDTGRSSETAKAHRG
eukprot:TRINITY_DN3135_c0_g1_i1.p5 TRINITY_DN3135_c0_g1~~TRINITY_DN3135_c0_g1_i1.p5  ORF type:complete len:57 (+),score=14.79 TRINITY_DN3135_c0_g1_i1:429-599(+)